MQHAPIPHDEDKRLEAVQSLKILDTPPEENCKKITEEAMSFFQVPISTISVLDAGREWFKSCSGECNLKEGPRNISFCGHALLSEQIFIVEDTLLDERFKDNPYVTGPPYIRFYAGMRLLERESKQPVGVFCIKDTKPRKLNLTEIAAFLELANRAETELNKRQPTP